MLRVLVADDDLESLRRTQQVLRGYRADWEFTFCHGPRMALEAMALEPYSVIVTNSMAGGVGASLLEFARDLFPEAVRIMVCPPSQQHDMLCAHGAAHQYLSEPVDSATFRETVARASALGARLTKPGLKALVSKITVLPSLPTIYVDLVQELRRRDASVSRVAELIGHDVGMTAKILHLVNSSFFGLAVHVKDVPHAASLLGLNALKPLVLSAAVFQELATGRVPVALAEQVFEHSLAVGSLARRLAEAQGLPRLEVDDAMLGGVLHDVGKLVLADHFGPEYGQVCLAAERAELALLSAELDQFDASHADVGGYLLGLWGLPQRLVEAVAWHHDPCALEMIRFTPLTAVHVANALVHAAEGTGDGLSQVDRRHLKQIRCEHCWPEWRRLAEVSEEATTAAAAVRR
jgi:putative nucleotidyltransferase with HDIG domain